MVLCKVRTGAMLNATALHVTLHLHIFSRISPAKKDPLSLCRRESSWTAYEKWKKSLNEGEKNMISQETYNNLYLWKKICGDICPRTSSVPRSEQFSEARGTSWASRNRECLINNYSPKWRWLVVDIYRAAKRRGNYPTLATDTEVNSCFSIY